MSLSSICKKQVMALTGLALCGFLVAHLAGNFLLLAGPAAFNTYAHKLEALGPTLIVAELGLVALFFVHLGMAIKLTIENKKAREVSYYMRKTSSKGATIASSTMPYTGLVILVFIFVHLANFKYGTNYRTDLDGLEVRDIYRTVVEYFRNPLYVAWYVFAMAALGMHTYHGFSSAFQSLGINHPKYNCWIKLAGKLFGVTVGGGFAFLAVWCHLKGGV